MKQEKHSKEIFDAIVKELDEIIKHIEMRKDSSYSTVCQNAIDYIKHCNTIDVSADNITEFIDPVFLKANVSLARYEEWNLFHDYMKRYLGDYIRRNG